MAADIYDVAVDADATSGSAGMMASSSAAAAAAAASMSTKSDFVDNSMPFVGDNPFMNVSSLFAYLRQLSADDRQLLYAQMGVASEVELLCSLAQKGLDTEIDAATVGISCYEQQLMQYDLYRLQKQLLCYLPPIIIVLGTFGNVFSFFILKRKAMLKFSTYFYLMVLAVADTLVLYIGLLPLWTRQVMGYDIFTQSDLLCKLSNMFGYAVSDFSVWLIIAVTCERYVVVYYPLKATSICDTTRAKRVITVILLVLLACNAHFLWTVKVVTYTHDGDVVLRCSGAAQHAFVIDHVWPWVDAMFYSFLPFVVITVVNVLIVRRIVYVHRHRDDLLRTGSVTSQQRPPPQANEGSTRMTIMLLTISFAFLLTTLPRTVAGIAAAFYNQYRRDLARVAAFEFAHTVTDLLMYVNHSMNFFLYCATGQKFRHQLVWMMCYARAGGSVIGGGGAGGGAVKKRRSNRRPRHMRKLVEPPSATPSGAGGSGGGGGGVVVVVAGGGGGGRRSNNSGGNAALLNAFPHGYMSSNAKLTMTVRKVKGDLTEMYTIVRPAGVDNNNCYPAVDKQRCPV